MAFSTVALSTRFGTNFAKDTDADNTADTLSSSSVTVYSVEINNTANASASSYIKFFNAASPTVGTDEPHMILKAQKAATVTYHFDQGIAFDTALSIAGLTTAGKAGTTGPVSNVVVKVVYD